MDVFLSFESKPNCIGCYQMVDLFKFNERSEPMPNYIGCYLVVCIFGISLRDS